MLKDIGAPPPKLQRNGGPDRDRSMRSIARVAALRVSAAAPNVAAALLAGRLREQQHDPANAIVAYRRAAATFGAAAETRNAATRAIERLERSRSASPFR